MKVILDTNVLISALIRDSTTRAKIISLEHEFYYPEKGLEELLYHKKEILKKSNLTDPEFKVILQVLFKYVLIVSKSDYESFLPRSKEIIAAIDPKDVIFIAAALAKNATIWSNDAHFMKQNSVSVITTKQILSYK
ncbi:PIN domain-containing protein [Candidatus Micrarchaeota archaeon]|nr:PIN domain-containing protein [Candidatus Micrarchaeota archaeon]